ncbi:group I intron-associated PD-(D/E)XK endonuclease, partial [Escherichia coli]|uniref:group I intron-associated PD-(D/E)XK endonuclease n=1 Tax=Escherichia coli TaxID=562 RepID=UPI0039658BD4
MIIAHENQVTGKLSEMTAARALLANGWEVSEPIVAEPYDLVAKDPVTGQFVTIQVKTIRRRSDRRNEMVIYATN